MSAAGSARSMGWRLAWATGLCSAGLVSCHKHDDVRADAPTTAAAASDRFNALVVQRVGAEAEIVELNTAPGFMPPFCGQLVVGRTQEHFVFKDGRLILQGDIPAAELAGLVAQYCLPPPHRAPRP